MNICEFIDAKSIIKIVYIKEWKNPYIKWKFERREERFFGLLNPTVYREGFYEDTYYQKEPYEISNLEKEFNIKNHTVYNRPFISIYFKGCSSETRKIFLSNDAAEEYILKLENLSGKKFECITK